MLLSIIEYIQFLYRVIFRSFSFSFFRFSFVISIVFSFVFFFLVCLRDVE